MAKNHEYSEVDSADAESLLCHSSDSVDTSIRIQRNNPTPNWPTISLIITLIFTHVLFAGLTGFATFWWARHEQTPLDKVCAVHTSQISPVLRDVKITYTETRYNGSFFHENIYRGDASPEVDAAWTALGVDYRALGVEEDIAEAAGISKDHVKINDKYGGGYPANVEGLHHLHCLNLLRKSLKYNYDYYKSLGEGAFKNEEYVVKRHITHCLDILRQQLMCTVDTGVLGQVWWDQKKPVPFVDFNTKHKCKNYEAIRKWAEERQLPEHPPADYLQGPTGKIYPEIP